MNTNSLSKILAATAFTVAAGLSMTAAAGDYSETLVSANATDVQSTTVSYDDLDLSSAAGREALHYRLSHAARSVCGSSDYRITGSVRQAAENRSCYQVSLAEATKRSSAAQVASNTQ